MGTRYTDDTGDYAEIEQRTGRDRSGRGHAREENDGLQRALIGAAAVAAAGGLAYLVGRKLMETGDDAPISDAPPSTFRGKARRDAPAERTVTINKPARELYEFWRDFTNFPQFMDNIRSVTKLDDKRSHWVIEAPAGTSVEFDSRITEDVPGRLIAWESEEGATVPNRGRIEFIDAPPGRGTMVRAIIDYEPPGGVVGKGIAKVMQREPNVQARRDLRRFKQLMETGEVTTSASPSGRKSEDPTEQYF